MDKNNINPYFKTLEVDYLYHLGLDTSMDLKAIFGEIRYVIFTLSHAEAAMAAYQFAVRWYDIHFENFKYQPIFKTERFHMYKVGVTIIISIGVGMPSLLIGLNEITKLLVHLDSFEVKFFMLGFCGGLGVVDGTIVFSHKVVNTRLEGWFESIECGDSYHYSTIMNDDLTKALFYFSHGLGYNDTIMAVNLSTYDFNEEQARLSGAITPSYTQKEAQDYLHNAFSNGIRSINMESLVFASFCNQLSIPGCVIGVSIVDRMHRETIDMVLNEQLSHLKRAADILARYIKVCN